MVSRSPRNASDSLTDGSNFGATSIQSLTMSSTKVEETSDVDDCGGELRAVINAIAELGDAKDEDMDNPPDPDAQQIVSEYSDFTEHLAADIHRSINLIDVLRRKANNAHAELSHLLRLYSQLPTLTGNKPVPAELRSQLSTHFNSKDRLRKQVDAENARMNYNVQKRSNQISLMRSKLQVQRDNFPSDIELAVEQPEANIQASRPKIVLRIDDKRIKKGANHTRRPRAPQIFVPGEINRMNMDDVSDTSSESESDDDADRVAALKAPNHLKKNNKRIASEARIKLEKGPRPPRAPGALGTNVHSTVAGISTSNALAKLPAPPKDARRGTEHRPWLALTEFELASLRKRMKKNAIWSPSPTMISRELIADNRGPLAYRIEKARAAEAGEPFDDLLHATSLSAVHGQSLPDGALSKHNIGMDDDLPITNRGMILNEAKKAKKLAERELQQQTDAAAAAEGTSAVLKNNLAAGLQGLFARTSGASARNNTKDAKEIKEEKVTGHRGAQKRKREIPADSDVSKLDKDANEASAHHPPKRSKTETPVPAPPSSQTFRTKHESSAGDNGSTVTTITTTTIVPLRSSPQSKSSTPILPPTRERRDLRRDSKAPVPSSAAANLPNANATGSVEHSIKTLSPTPPPQEPVPRRPASRGKLVDNDTSSIGKDRPRRASTVHSTPIPEAPPTRPASRRGKRSAPVPVGTEVEGSAAVKTGREHAPRKRGNKKQSDNVETEVVADAGDADGEVIDPNEETYCSCHQVQFGVMICCDRDEVREIAS